MKPQWILLANASTARIFQRTSPGEAIVPLATMKHPASRLKAGMLSDDRPGREATDHSRGGNRYEPRSDAHRKEHRRFANEVSGRLDAGLMAGAFDTLWLFASNPFLGELKAELSEAVARRLELLVDSDLCALDVADIEERLRHHRAPRRIGA